MRSISFMFIFQSAFDLFTIVASTPGKHLMLIGHRQNMGGSTWHLHHLITQ